MSCRTPMTDWIDGAMPGGLADDSIPWYCSAVEWAIDGAMALEPRLGLLGSEAGTFWSIFPSDA